MINKQVSRPANILLVEDNLGDVRLTKEVFREVDMKVNLDVVMDAVEALSYLSKEGQYATAKTPDLILLDLNLPKKHGTEVLEFIKTDENLVYIPVIILTTSGAESDIMDSYQLHANCYLNKPLEYNAFFNLIQQLKDFWLDETVLPTMIN